MHSIFKHSWYFPLKVLLLNFVRQEMVCLRFAFLCFYTPFWKTGRIMGTPVTAFTGFPLSKSKSFHQVFIKLGEYVGGHKIMTKFYNQPNPPRHSWIMALELSKNWISSICSQVEYPAPKKCCHYHWIYHKYDGRILCRFGTLVL